MHLPQISIITPTLNQAPYIGQCIESIIGQDYPNLQYIIMDGGSTDGTSEIVKKYESQIACFISEKDEGQSDAITKGIRKSTGDIVHWINSDDYLEPGALQAVAAAWKPGTKCVCGTSRIFSSIREWSSQTDLGSDFFMFSKSRIDQPATWFSGEFMRANHPDKNLHLAMDLDLWYRFLLEHDSQTIISIPNLLVHFREHDDAKSTRLAQKMLFERASLALEMRTDLMGKTSGRYSPYAPKMDGQRKQAIQKGCLDFALNAYRSLISPKTDWGNQLGTKIKGAELKPKELFTFLKIKTVSRLHR